MRKLLWLTFLYAGAVAAQPPAGDKEALQSAEVEAMQPAVDAGDITPTEAAAAAPAQAPSAGASPIPRPAAEMRAAAGSVMDTLDLGTTSITGSQELPKVLYIVPWKRSDLGEVAGRPVNTLLDEVLAPVDPDVFQRHLEYYDALYGEGNEE